MSYEIYNELNNFDIDIENGIDKILYGKLYPNDTEETGEPIYIEVRDE
jgi:hypothetical protein